jgi:hypothetical protein
MCYHFIYLYTCYNIWMMQLFSPLFLTFSPQFCTFSPHHPLFPPQPLLFSPPTCNPASILYSEQTQAVWLKYSNCPPWSVPPALPRPAHQAQPCPGPGGPFRPSPPPPTTQLQQCSSCHSPAPSPDVVSNVCLRFESYRQRWNTLQHSEEDC